MGGAQERVTRLPRHGDLRTLHEARHVTQRRLGRGVERRAVAVGDRLERPEGRGGDLGGGGAAGLVGQLVEGRLGGGEEDLAPAARLGEQRRHRLGDLVRVRVKVRVRVRVRVGVRVRVKVGVGVKVSARDRLGDRAQHLARQPVPRRAERGEGRLRLLARHA
eukprot:scaffold10482_cov53-Phaeocystis_antarctica.AAC.4